MGNVGFGGGCWAGVTRIGRRVQHGKSLGMLLPCGAWGWGGDLRRRKSCSGPGMGAWIGAADALCACSSSPGGRNSLRWFPASQNRGQVLRPSLGGGAVPELEPLLRVLRGGIPVGRVGGVTPPLPGEYRSPLRSRRLPSRGSPCSAELCPELPNPPGFVAVWPLPAQSHCIKQLLHLTRKSF